MKRRLVWICMAVSAAFIAFTVGGVMLDFLFGEKGEETLYEAFLTDRAYAKSLEGRPIDQALLEEMTEGYGRLPEVTKNSVGSLSVVAGMILLSMFVSVPEQYRVLAQLWSYFPSEFIATWNIFNPRTVPLFGTFLLPWQAAVLLYLLAGTLFALIGKRRFVRYQVSGR